MASANDEQPVGATSTSTGDETVVVNARLQSENEDLRKRLAALEETMKARARPKRKYTSDDFDKLVDDAIETAESSVTLKRSENDTGDGETAEHIISDPQLEIKSVVPKIMNRRKKSRRQKGRKFGCGECGKFLASSLALQNHQKIHEGEHPYKSNSTEDSAFQCGLCSRTFKRKTSLIVHMRSHTGDKPCVCECCGKRFNDQAQLDRHMARHTGGKPFKCSVCARGFSQSGNMHRHEKTHTGETPFECHECGKKFTRAGKLSNHKCAPGLGPFKPRIFRPGPHVCHICHREFPQARLLDQHVPRHTSTKPNICTKCGKSFGNQEKLVQHMRCHYSDKPFQCHMCYKGFVKKSYLFEHMKIHVSNKVYRCEICWKSFTKKCYLNKHHRFIHKKNRPYKMCETSASIERDKTTATVHHQQVQVENTTMVQHPQLKEMDRSQSQSNYAVQVAPDDHQQQLHHAFMQHGNHSNQQHGNHSNLVQLHGQLEPPTGGVLQMIQNIPGIQFMQNQSFMIAQTPHVVQTSFHGNQQQVTQVLQPAVLDKQQQQQFVNQQSTQLHQSIQSMQSVQPIQAVQPTQPIHQQRSSDVLRDPHTNQPTPSGTSASSNTNNIGQGPHQCKQCGKRYGKMSGLIKHMKRHEEPEAEPEPPVTGEHSCHICEQTFTKLDDYRKHLEDHSKEAATKAATAMELNPVANGNVIQVMTLPLTTDGSKNHDEYRNNMIVTQNEPTVREQQQQPTKHQQVPVGSIVHTGSSIVHTGSSNTILMTPDQARLLASRLQANGQFITQLNLANLRVSQSPQLFPQQQQQQQQVQVQVQQQVHQQQQQDPQQQQVHHQYPPQYQREFMVNPDGVLTPCSTTHGLDPSLMSTLVHSTAPSAGVETTYSTATIGGLQIQFQSL